MLAGRHKAPAAAGSGRDPLAAGASSSPDAGALLFPARQPVVLCLLRGRGGGCMLYSHCQLAARSRRRMPRPRMCDANEEDATGLGRGGTGVGATRIGHTPTPHAARLHYRREDRDVWFGAAELRGSDRARYSRKGRAHAHALAGRP